jgi:enolase
MTPAALRDGKRFPSSQTSEKRNESCLQNSKAGRRTGGDAVKSTIKSIDAMEVLDSRGYPTVRVDVRLEGGAHGTARAPSGASTGAREKAERRDADEARYSGRGVLSVVSLIRSQVDQQLAGRDVFDQVRIDEELQGFHGKGEVGLGSNGTAAISMAIACAAAATAGLPLYKYLGGPNARRLPVPMMNVLNGGKHADNSLDFQEFMIFPIGAPNFAEALRYGAETFHTLKGILAQRGYVTAVGDEGGFAPNLEGNREACSLIVEAIAKAGYEPGRDIAIALDPAASSFWRDGEYHLRGNPERVMNAEALTSEYADLVAEFPIVSIEDGFAEDDWDAFAAQTKQLGGDLQIVGDDLYVTDAETIRRGVQTSATNAVLIKINQVGTVTHAMQAIEVCRQNGLAFIVSHRSGETEDTFIADFAVAMSGGQIKTGSLSRSERIAKYNRLLEIEYELGDAAEFYYSSPPTSVPPKPQRKSSSKNHTLKRTAPVHARARSRRGYPAGSSIRRYPV